MTRKLLLAFTAIGMLSTPALADSISPETFDATLAIGESVTITKTVTVTKENPTSALVDVKFVADTTGSMGGIINSVRTNASSILTNLSSYGSVEFGVSEYKDRTDSFTTRTNTAMTDDHAAVQAGINQWGASGGGDGPEANLIALKEQAEAGDWRSGSTRFIIQFGDAPGHEGGAYPTLAETQAALTDNNVKLLVLGTSGMNAGCGDCTPNAATLLANATGGSFNLLNSGYDVAAIIAAAIDEAFSTYSKVALGVIGGSTGVDVAITPISYEGSWDREEDRTFTFDVTFTGVEAGLHEFGIGAYVDGGLVATELDRITVVAAEVPLPATLPLMLGALGLGGLLLRRRRS